MSKREKFHLQGDKAEVYRTKILKQYPFPEYKGENFLTEAVVWDKIAHDGFKIRWFNEIIYKCEYLADGLTKSGEKLFINNFEGFTHYIRLRTQFYDWLTRQKAIAYYLELAKKKGLRFQEIRSKLQISSFQIIIPLSVFHPLRMIKKNHNKEKIMFE